jgi:hypothetical protein
MLAICAGAMHNTYIDSPTRANHMTEKHMEIAKTIQHQMNGLRMIGARNLIAGETGTGFGYLQFQYGAGLKAANKSTHCRVVLEPDDTYTVKFFKVRGTNCTEVSIHDTVYCDDLIRLFEKETTLYLTM